MNCIFCDILYGAAPATTVYDGISSLGIVPLNPIVKGHVIFMPRKHVRDASENPAVAAALMADAAQYIQHLRQRGDTPANGPDFNIITSIGPAATQSVFHLHLHLVPRKNNDGLALPWHSGKTKKEKKKNAQPSALPREQSCNPDHLKEDLTAALHSIMGSAYANNVDIIETILVSLMSYGDAKNVLRSVKTLLNTHIYAQVLRYSIEHKTSLRAPARTLVTTKALKEMGMTLSDLDWTESERDKA